MLVGILEILKIHCYCIVSPSYSKFKSDREGSRPADDLSVPFVALYIWGQLSQQAKAIEETSILHTQGIKYTVVKVLWS